MPRHHLRHSISCRSARSDVLQAKSQPCPGPKILPHRTSVCLGIAWLLIGCLNRLSAWQSVISEPQRVLCRRMADHEIEMPPRTANCQIRGRRTAWLWPDRDVSLRIAKSAISCVAALSQNAATVLYSSLSLLSTVQSSGSSHRVPFLMGCVNVRRGRQFVTALCASTSM